MSHRLPISLLALVAAGLYAVTGALELTHEQPAVFADPIDYWIEGAFAAALAVTAACLALLARSASTGRAGWALAAAGTAGLTISAVATAVEGADALGPLFMLGVLGLVAGYVTLTVADVRGRLSPSRAGIVLLVGFVASIAVESTGAGGIVLAASWAATSRLLAAGYAGRMKRSGTGGASPSVSW